MILDEFFKPKSTNNLTERVTFDANGKPIYPNLQNFQGAPAPAPAAATDDDAAEPPVGSTPVTPVGGSAQLQNPAARAEYQRVRSTADKFSFSNPEFRKEYDRIARFRDTASNRIMSGNRSYSPEPGLAARQHQELVKMLYQIDADFVQDANILLKNYGALKEQDMDNDNLQGTSPDDEVKFFIDSESAYYAVMDRFGDHIEFRGDDMVAPLRLWGAIQQTAGDAGGAADIAGLEDDRMGTDDELDEQGMAEGLDDDEEQLHTRLVYNHGADKLKQQWERDENTPKLIANIQKLAKIKYNMTINAGTAEWIAADLVHPDILEQSMAEGAMDDKITKHNAAVAKLPGGQAHRSNHPNLLKSAPQGYSFSVSHKLVPDQQGVSEGSDRIAANKQDRLQALENKLKAKGYVKTKDSDGGEYQYRWTRDGAPSYVVNYRSGANGYAEFRKEQGVAEGHGNYAGDQPVNLGGVSMKKIQIGDTVRYIDQKAQVVDMSRDREHARITIPSSATTKTVLTSDLRQLGRGVSEETLSELSPATLARYKTKAGAAATAADSAGDRKTGDRRFSGIVKATKKQFDQDAKQSAQAVHESRLRLMANIIKTQ